MPEELEWLDGVPVFTVGQFSDVLNGVLSQTFSDGVWVEGEIQGLRSPTPHLYFSLVENADGAKAQLSVSIFAGPLRNVQAKLRAVGAQLKEGMRIRVYGKVDYYPPSGRLSLKVSDVDTQFTAGDIAQKREELIRRLQADGSVRQNKLREVPLVPLRLGIISSGQAAGYADARKHLVESGIGFSVTFCDVRVQGDDAAPMVVGALGALGRRNDIDVVLLIRGGGSKADLAAFDDERIARAIAGCPHPVFTGIGHEIDQSVADIVAHTACKTPTACADAVIDRVFTFLERLDEDALRVRTLTGTVLERARGRVSVARERLVARPRAALERERHRLAVHATSVRLLDPASTMARGWSITRRADGTVVRAVGDVTVGDAVTIVVADGTFTSRVEETN